MMNISEVFSIMKNNESNNKIFREGLLFNMKTVEPSVGNLFYKRTSRRDTIYGLSNSELKEFRNFSVKYICYLLSNYPYRGMSGAVKNCSISDILNWVNQLKSGVSVQQAKPEDYVHQAIFEKIAVDAYYLLGIKDYVRSTEFKTVLTNEMMFKSHAQDYAWCLKAMLFLVHMEDNAKAAKILADWNSWDSSKDWTEYYNYNWIDVFVNELPNSMAVYNALYDGVSAACGKIREEQRRVQGGSYAGGYPVSYSELRTYTYYGEEVGAWLKSTAKNYGFFEREPAYMGTKPPSSGCVKKGTGILLSSLNECPVEQLKYKDKITSCKNLPSFCSDGLIYNPEVTSLYSVNDDEPFMSPEHPILTKRGWCSLEPELSMRINPEYEILKLEIGDCFMKAVVNQSVLSFTEVIIDKINRVFYETPQECYDLNIYDGYHSYYANGYPCLCNYPQITAASIKKAMERLSEEEFNSALQMFTEQRNLLNKLLGENAVATLLTEL